MAAIGDVARNILWLIPLLGVIIFFHESGHFLVAKAFGMRVFIFSFGFGKRLFGFKRGDTDYRVSLIPLGGYVKLEGEPDDVITEDTAPRGDGNDFTSRPRWQRLAVYLAGPAMNGVLTVLVFWIMFAIGAPVPGILVEPPVIGYIEPASAAERSGFKPADHILSIDGDKVADWQGALINFGLRPGREVDVVVNREGQETHLRVKPVLRDKSFGDIGVAPIVRVGVVTPGGAAEAGGLRTGDGILSIGDRILRGFGEIPELLGTLGDVPLKFEVVREDARLSLTITPRGTKIGVGNHFVPRQFPIGQAFSEAVKESVAQTKVLVRLVQRLLSGRVAAGSALSGPVDIAKNAGAAADRGAMEYLQLMALLSISVGVLNLFPMAPLDGGHIAVLVAEMAIRRDLSERIKVVFLNVGFVLIMALMLFILYSDLSKTWVGKFLP